MQIQVHTDGNVDGAVEFEEHVRTTISSRLLRFTDDVTRVDVHLADESAGRSTGDDKRCMIEARLAWHSPVTVTCHSSTVDGALSEAAGKIVTVLSREVDRRGHRKGGPSIRTDSPPPEEPAASRPGDVDPRGDGDGDTPT